MGDLHLNKVQKFFYFETRIHFGFLKKKSCKNEGKAGEIERENLWKHILEALAELRQECGIEIYGLIQEQNRLKIIFSTPYFNENILILDWEMRIQRKVWVQFERPILCEPVTCQTEVKRRLLEIYSTQIDRRQDSIRWRNSFNSLKLLLEGNVHAAIFTDPLKIIFRPSLLLQYYGKR